GRICAVADVFDALTSARPYKPALSNNQTCRILEEGRGRHFDPHLVNLFLTHFEEVAAIQERYREESHTEVADDGALDPRPTSISAAGTASRRILVVVHDADVAEMLVDLLELWGHDVRAAHREVEAVQLCVAFRPDLVLVDVGPSPLDGCAVARQLRKQRGTRGTVLVAITPYSSPDRRREFGAADFDDHLLKPIDPEHLQRLVRPPGSGASPTPE
ncbi:MAG TPA: response regulator, partial [Armatimonadota bacterium]|nr:response regulator [Armatimonadota bacterium]